LTAQSLGGALERVARLRIDSERLHDHAGQFSRERHVARLRETIDDTRSAPAGTEW
jgi:hypothetical protein